MELDTVLHGVTPPPLESCEEKAKRQKTEPEPESDSESDSEPEPIDWDWVSKPIEYLRDKYEDDPIPRYFSCTRFVYKNKVVREQEEAEEKAVAEYLKTARNISVRLFLSLSLRTWAMFGFMIFDGMDWIGVVTH